jgi:phosphoadenosine phosphosulfate reductase
MGVYWCRSCEVPIIDKEVCNCGTKTKYLAADVRPVFPEEKYLLAKMLDDNSFIKKTVWATKGHRYFIDGKSKKLPLTDLMRSVDKNKISKDMQQKDFLKEEDYSSFNVHIQKFIDHNKDKLYEKEYAALDFIKSTVTNDKYKNSLPIVSFSGGKDSTIVSHLVRRALSNPAILHIFGNTTLEFPLTYEYIERFRRENARIPFFIAKSQHDFMELCQGGVLPNGNGMGPPSRVMRWCCTIFKTGPINSTINSFIGDKTILTFYGIRKSESPGRSGYQQVYWNNFDKIKDTNIDKSPKISKQRVTSPVFDWLNVDVWLYILAHSLDFNEAYRLGFTRVGCWPCPSNSSWSEFLRAIYMPEQDEKWTKFLVDFARSVGKEDAEEYVTTGKWKARQGGAGLDNKHINITAQDCVEEEYTKNYVLTRPINEELYEYFKPFGIVNKELGNKFLNEVFIIDRRTGKSIIKLQGKLGAYKLKVKVLYTKNYRLLSQRIDCQLRKFQSCIGCLGCISVCPSNAISYVDETYRINADKCTSCLECINPWRGGCLMTKVLAVKKGAN